MARYTLFSDLGPEFRIRRVYANCSPPMAAGRRAQRDQHPIEAHMRIPSTLLRVLALTALVASPIISPKPRLTFMVVNEMTRAGKWSPSEVGTL